MSKVEKYKLYDSDGDYIARFTLNELKLVFDPGAASIDDIKKFLIDTNSKYCIKDK